MADRPLIFSAPMIRTLLAGTKSQTRRSLKPQPIGSVKPGVSYSRKGMEVAFGPGNTKPDGSLRWWPLPAVCDQLWCREAWRAEARFDATAPRDIPPGSIVSYEADYDREPNDGCRGKLRPSIFLPRWASRLTLTVTEVRVERVQSISEADARAEGVGLYVPGHGFITDSELRADPGYSNFLSPRAGFEALWTEIHGPGAWEANPFVVALTFSVERRNIDAAQEPNQ